MQKIRAKDDDGYLWNFIFSILYIGAIAGLIIVLQRSDTLPESVNILQITLMALAAFRLVRLFVYDEVMDFVRDACLITQKGEDITTGELVTIKTEPENGVRRTVAHLLDCPWCMGSWAALFVVFVNYYFTWGWVVLLVLSISAIATFIQILTNMIGWKAQRQMQKVQEHRIEE